MNTISSTGRFSLHVGWGDILLDLGAGSVRLTQNWDTHWELLRGAPPVTAEEISVWHQQMQRHIDTAFHGVRLQLTQKQGRRKVTSQVTVSMEVLHAPESRQWIVRLRRFPPEHLSAVSAFLNLSLRTINAGENDFSGVTIAREMHRVLLPELVKELNQHLPGLQFAT